MAEFILKRKRYGVLDKVYKGLAEGDIYKGRGIAGGSGTVAGLARNVAAPVSVAGMVGDQAKNAIQGTLKDAAAVAKEYTPTVKNAYVNPTQSTFSAGQAIKEIGTGVGKGIWEYAKKNKKSIGGLAAFGAASAAGTYGLNRIQRQRAEIDAGEREGTGMSTGGKAIAGLATAGTAAGLAYKTAKSHDSKAADLTKTISENTAAAKKNAAEGFGKRAAQLEGRAAKGAAELEKLNRKRLGGLVSNKTFKMGRNALIGSGLMAGAGLLANSMLKDKKNSDVDQRSYTFAAVGRLTKGILSKGLKNKPTSDSIGGLITQNIKEGNWGTLGKAAGTAFERGGEQLAKTASNFFTIGKGGASELTKDIAKNLKNQGEYGKKAADFINRHKTATGVVGAATVGTAGFQLANAAGEKPVQLATKLDKKTNQYIKNQQAAGGQS